MHFVVMGCGRVGSTLAGALERHGHSVAVVDKDEQAFGRLGPDFAGRTVHGVGFDRDVLLEAGVEEAYAFAAVSSGDNSNILAARVAREVFGVENVAARIYDSARAEVYERLGIPTVATVKWTADQMVRRLLPRGVVPDYTDASGAVHLAQVSVPTSWVGHRLAELEQATQTRVAFVTRLGTAQLPRPGTVHQEGDVVHLLVPDEAVTLVEKALDAGPEPD
ncbi:TrkA family potassium uptake protein [Pseudokineococcus basanitobsidens]|uniref:Trk system potassium uptake protein TrkA n=1 Tax=Pseudokineococcus basanitobsidens TaxID=1926649 RepID=A0ABU8RHH5_9ACTN